MYRRLLLLALGLCPQLVGAAEVKWTARGSVSFVLGADLTPLASIADPVQIEFSYDNTATGEIFTQLFSPRTDQLFWEQAEYSQDVDIDIKITIRGNTWHGTLTSGTDAPFRTIEIQDVRVGGGTKDFFKLNVAANDGASFPSFPGVAEGDRRILNVEFSDAAPELEDLPDYINSTALKCVSQSVSRVTAAKGSVSTGMGQLINFTIDPTSISTELVGVSSIRITSVKFVDDALNITFDSEPGKFYVIEALDEFSCWQEVSSEFAIGSETTARLFPFLPKEIYRIVLEDE